MKTNMTAESIYLVVLFSAIIPILGASMSKTVLYQAPDECRWSGFAESDVVLVCHLRTINSELENTNFSVIQPQNTIRLRLECNEALFFQSSLSPGSFKALVELRSLTIEYCKLGNLTAGSFRGLLDLRNLTIRTHNGDWSSMSLDISPNIFNDLKYLERLDLSQNNIWLIPEGLICPLHNINYLNISHNRIQDIRNFHFSASLITRKSMSCGASLTVLDLSTNKISNIPSAIFSALNNLKKLILTRNEINFIADKAFERLVSLTTLNLSENKLNNLPPELFSETKNLKEIYLKNNSINVLAPGLFSDLSGLLVLDLSENELNSQWVNSATFMGLWRLVLLDLSANKINKLEPNIFKNLQALEVLKLQNNYIDNIPDNTFADLTNLHTLVISNNRLANIDALTLSGLYRIILLSLDYNRIYKIDPLAFKNCSSLQDLHLNSNKLSKVPEALHYVSLLKTLDLGENQISSLENGSFGIMENLYGLRLTENAIAFIRNGVFDGMVLLQILNLSRNRIKTIEPGSFKKNVHLQAVRLDGNLLKNIDGLFSKLPNLVWLNISDNYLESFDYAHIPQGLQWLDIHANKITQLSNYFDMESEIALSTFDASSNRLTEISAGVIPNSIEFLYLNDNRIWKIQSYTFFKKPNLTRVDLVGNQLNALDLNALRLSPVPAEKPIPEFYIGGNPFQCDCNLDWLQKTNVESRTQPKLMDLASIYCKLLYNKGKAYMPLIEAKSNDFLCKYETHCFALCHCCEFYACDCKMECPIGCTCYHDQSWSSNVVDCSLAEYQNLPEHIPMDSTQLYLDGNNFSEIGSHAFIGKKRLKILFMNNSNIDVLRNRTFYGLRELEILQLHSNNVRHLYGNEFEGLENLKELYLQYNKISVVDNYTFFHLHHLRKLRLDHNEIMDLEFSNLPSYLLDLRISGNAWTCECKTFESLYNYVSHHDFVKDKKDIACITSKNFSLNSIESNLKSKQEKHLIFSSNNAIQCFVESEKENDVNIVSTKMILTPESIHNYIPVLIATFCGCLLVITFVLLIFIFRQEMRVWFHSRFGVRLFYNATDMDKNERDNLYDAFISYSSKDDSFVAEELAPILENGDPQYKICLHYRDFPVGAFIADTIVQAIESSRRTIMVLSDNFMKSEWCRFEFKSAHHQALRDRRRRLIVILLGEIPQKDLDPDIRLYLKTNTYLQWGDKLFWEKLRFALPDVPNNQRRTHCNYNITSLQHSIFCNHNIRNINTRHNNGNNNANQIMLTQSSGRGRNSSSPRTVAIHI